MCCMHEMYVCFKKIQKKFYVPKYVLKLTWIFLNIQNYVVFTSQKKVLNSIEALLCVICIKCACFKKFPKKFWVLNCVLKFSWKFLKYKKVCCFYFFKDSAKFHKNHILCVIYINPNVPVGWVGKVRKKGRRKWGWRKKPAQRACRARCLNPGPAAC